jgi:hypothetical protein
MTNLAAVLNIMHVFTLATDDEIREGATWYNDAHRLALELSPEDVWRGAGVIAAFSPLTPWTQNVILARRLFANDGVMEGGTLANSISAATRIYNGEHTLDVLKGDKTRAFASAIADPHGSTIATIDRHAYDIAMGATFVDSTRKIGKRVFRDLSDAYVVAANELGFSVAQTQAITWVAVRRIKGVKV